jgi:histone H3/H4
MSYVVGTKVKELLKKHGCMCAGDFVEALNAEVEGLVEAAAKRASSNGRKTARGGDL